MCVLISRHIFEFLFIRNCFIHISFFKCFMPSRADDIYWAFNHYLLDECMNTFTLNSMGTCVCICTCAFLQVQFYSTFSQALSGLGVHLLSELYSTLALLIKRNIFRLSKERDCSSFYLCCRYSFTYMLFILFQTECHKNIHFIRIFSSLLLKCKNCQCSQWLGWTNCQSHLPLGVIFTELPRIYT